MSVAAPRRLSLVAVGVSSAALGVHALSYWPFLADDALISLRYAERLLEGHGLTWTAGPPVEGYSNLLWVLATSGLGALGADLVVAARVLGALGMLAVLCAVARPHARSSSLIPGLAAAGVVAASGSIAIWTIGGLEQPLLAALLAWSIVAALPLVDGRPVASARCLWSGVPLGLMCWTRPDAPLFVACFAAAALLAARFELRAWWSAALLCAPPALAVLGQLAFRLSYYGDWVPNTAHIKGEVSLQRILEGLDYVASGAVFLSPALALAALGLYAGYREPRLRGRVLLLGAAGLAWIGYVALIGGDIFPGRRHLVPAVVLIAFLVGSGLEWAIAAGASRRALAWTTAGALALLLGLQQLDGAQQKARSEHWEWDGQVVGMLLRDAFVQEQPLLAVTAAGTVPYFSGLPSLDMLGLNDRHIARQPSLGGTLAHDHGDAGYVMDRAPDLIMLGKPPGKIEATRPAERQLLAEPRFQRGYQLVHFEGRHPYTYTSRIWVRREGRVGVRREAAEVRIPAYLLESDPPARARLDDAGRIAAELPADGIGRVRVSLAAGGWQLDVDADAPAPEIRALDAAGRPLTRGQRTLRFVLAAEQEVTFELVGTRGALARAVTLRRADGR